ncbi:MAG TPA: ABC transporter permease [Wenzhouxiangella sp.]
MAKLRKNRRAGQGSGRFALAGDGIRAWFGHHGYSFFSSLGELIRRPVNAGMTIVVLGLALTLPLALFLVVSQVSQLTEGIDRVNGLSVFLETSVAEDQAIRLSSQLSTWSEIMAVDPISPAQGLTEALGHLGVASTGFGPEDNPLPWVLEVTLAMEVDMAALSERLMEEEGIAQVIVDLAWLARLELLIELGERIVYVVGVLLMLAFLFVIAHSIRMEVHHRRHQIEVMALVGATPAFIRRPFLYSGFWFGVSAATLALVFVLLASWGVSAPLRDLAESYQINLAFDVPRVGASVALILGMGCVGILGSWVAVSQQLLGVWPRD